MTDIHLDHFITYTDAGSIDDYMRTYELLGFLPDRKTVRHEPGLRNRFIFIGPEYLEFCWVEDEALFARATAGEKLFRAASRPYGLGLIAADVHAVHADWIQRGYPVPEVISKAPRDAGPDAPPLWSFQDIPPGLLPGVWSFVLTYHARKQDDFKEIQVHPNTIYAVSGITLVAEQPESRATCWRDLLVPDEKVIQSASGYEIVIAPHRVRWMTPDIYRSTFDFDWVEAPHPTGELAVLHLLATDLDIVRQRSEQAGRGIFSSRIDGMDELVIAPDKRDGFMFSIRQYPFAWWVQERATITGERYELRSGE